MIVDGGTGDVHVRPPNDVERSYADKVKLRARRQAQYHKLRDKPSITACGEQIHLMMNAGLLVDLPYVAETGAAGIGLFRTELQFMVAPSLPRAGEQEALYRSVLDSAEGKPVVFRTLDIGGDKMLPYLRTIDEENPALGWRAIRFGLDRPGLLRAQIRALARAAARRDLRVMFPMIAAVEEFDAAKEIVEKELTHLRKWGHELPERVMLGAMVEVPSLLFELDASAGEGGFRIGRHERPDPVHVCGRSRQFACGGPFRSAQPRNAEGLQDDRRRGAFGWKARDRLR